MGGHRRVSGAEQLGACLAVTHTVHFGPGLDEPIDQIAPILPVRAGDKGAQLLGAVHDTCR
jgi:hypothetical protein